LGGWEGRSEPAHQQATHTRASPRRLDRARTASTRKDTAAYELDMAAPAAPHLASRGAVSHAVADDTAPSVRLNGGPACVLARGRPPCSTWRGTASGRRSITLQHVARYRIWSPEQPSPVSRISLSSFPDGHVTLCAAHAQPAFSQDNTHTHTHTYLKRRVRHAKRRSRACHVEMRYDVIFN
jgi:hypothetical protein